MLHSDIPALILAPMDGVTDAPMRSLQGELGGLSYAVSEFLRVNHEAPPAKVFHRHIPELRNDGMTRSGLPVQVQILGGDAGRMAEAAWIAYEAGAKAIDVNFGCPAPTVNRHDGGATLLKHPSRIREIIAAIRDALPKEIPVSAKLRLGWDSIDSIHENAEMAAEGGASWLTIHGRTRAQGYAPPAHWEPIGLVNRKLKLPIVANGDIWTIEDFRRCREVTGCRHFMIGRGALANPGLSNQIACELGISSSCNAPVFLQNDWLGRLNRLVEITLSHGETNPGQALRRMKQWLNLARLHGDFTDFEYVKRAQTTEELLSHFKTPALV